MIKLDQDNFKEEVLKSRLPVLVVFWSPGCGACSSAFSFAKEASDRLTGEAKIAELNIFFAPEIAKEYGVPAVPTLVIFKDGKVRERAVGSRSAEILIEKIRTLA